MQWEFQCGRTGKKTQTVSLQARHVPGKEKDGQWGRPNPLAVDKRTLGLAGELRTGVSWTQFIAFGMGFSCENSLLHLALSKASWSNAVGRSSNRALCICPFATIGKDASTNS